MISVNNLSLKYENRAILKHINFSIPEGELVLLAGATGSGKSSLLHIIDGLVPTFTGGDIHGDISIDGISKASVGPLDWSRLVATVAQSPEASFVADNVEDEIAFGMETHGYALLAMRQRVEEVLDLLSLAPLRHRQLHTLSGGQQQRVAIAAALTMNPRVLLLDEPTSALDPVAADEVLNTVQRLVHDLGLTVLVAEHRIERVMHYADRVLLLDDAGQIHEHLPESAMRSLPIPPVLTQLADLAGSTETPLTVRDTRRIIEPLRKALAAQHPPLRIVDVDSSPTVEVTGLSFVRDKSVILRDISMSASSGSITAIMGRNGAGKSTFLHALMGDFEPTTGTVEISHHKPTTLRGSDLLRVVSIVPQKPSDLFICDRVSDECRTSDKAHNIEPGTTRAILALLAPTIEDDQHPRDLSEGQQLSLALAIAMAGQPDVLLLDEPTRGLDSIAKQQLIRFMREGILRDQTIIVATHDVELAAEVAHRVLVLADGEIVAHGNVDEVLTASAMFAPVTARVLSPLPWLTVSDVRAAMDNL